mmetsp:Transcript_18402/g.51086  ORF Transcript_18402/g.51086 Transcript_18402/m.51086 type:complete len:138 (-) Transcript_18402:1045-1458(-)
MKAALLQNARSVLWTGWIYNIPLNFIFCRGNTADRARIALLRICFITCGKRPSWQPLALLRLKSIIINIDENLPAFEPDYGGDRSCTLHTSIHAPFIHSIDNNHLFAHAYDESFDGRAIITQTGIWFFKLLSIHLCL